MSVRVRLVFPEALVREPVLARLARSFDVQPNIRRASVDEDSGWIVCELEGNGADVERALAWLAETGVRVELLGDVVES
ncbi:MAG TPA: NIL domain-containing protein [Acidimicrobiales bacterium]|nr:NIL domain-containing protein [Acidimicrobiales bacterium]